MDRVEFYSGEPSGSPEIFSDPNDMSGQFVVNAKDIYGSNTAPAMQYNPYGFQNSIQQPQPNFMNPPVQGQVNFGYGYNQPQQPMYNPMFMNGYQQPPYPQYGYQQQFGAPMNIPTMQHTAQTIDPSQINTGYVANPAIAMLNQWQQQGIPYQPINPYQQPNGYYDPVRQQVMFAPQQQAQDRIVNVPGYNPSGSIGMLTSDAEQICDQMQVDMMCEQQALIAKRQQRSQGVFNANMGGYSNYYGSPYVFNAYCDTSVYNKYMQKLQDMKQEAINRRTNLNKRLSMICHNYLNDGITESDINRIYDGYSYTIPGTSVAEYETQARLERMVPVSNAAAYQEHSRQVSVIYNMMAPPGHNMNEFFADAAMFKIFDNLEAEFHRRKNTQNYYDTDIYHEYIRKYAMENDIKIQEEKHNREIAEKLTDLTLEKRGEVTKQDIMNILYTPERVEELRNKGFVINPDGTTELRIPEHLFSDNSPPTQRPEINCENELDYEMRKSAFVASIYNNKSSCVGG